MDEPPADVRAPVPSGDESAAPVTGQGDLRITAADEFLTAATKEYEQGHVDQTLWARASAHAGDDQSLVIAAYLRARATALQLQKRERHRLRRARRAKARDEARNRNVGAEPRAEIPPAAGVGARLGGLQAKPKHLVAAAAAVASVGLAVWLIASPPTSAPTSPLRVTAAAKSTERPPPAVPVKPVQARTSGADERDPIAALSATVQQLKDEGNWNVLVLYASKWTREEPYNAAAWKELSIGYANLHQFDDAAVAAGKAAQLSPGDALLWRNLGHLDVALERLDDAEKAFDKALAISAVDAGALCGSALVAYKLGRAKDANEIAKRVDPAYGRCPGLDDGESVTVVVRPVAPVKSASKGRR